MSCGLTSTLMNNYWSLGDRGFAPFQGGTNVFSVADSFDMIRGKHDIRVGGSHSREPDECGDQRVPGWLLHHSGLHRGCHGRSTLLGQVVAAKHDQTFAGATTGRRWKMYRPYVQDDWRVTSDLTVNLGLAWALTTPITEAGNRQANYDFATGKAFCGRDQAWSNGCSICVQRRCGRHQHGQDRSRAPYRTGLEADRQYNHRNSRVDTLFSTILPGTRVRKDCGRIHHTSQKSDNFTGADCPFGNPRRRTPKLRCVALSSCRLSLRPRPRPLSLVPSNPRTGISNRAGCSNST